MLSLDRLQMKGFWVVTTSLLASNFFRVNGLFTSLPESNDPPTVGGGGRPASWAEVSFHGGGGQAP